MVGCYGEFYSQTLWKEAATTSSQAGGIHDSEQALGRGQQCSQPEGLSVWEVCRQHSPDGENHLCIPLGGNDSTGKQSGRQESEEGSG